MAGKGGAMGVTPTARGGRGKDGTGMGMGMERAPRGSWGTDPGASDAAGGARQGC